MNAVKYLQTGSTDPAYNLAFEEYVLTHCTQGDYLILWQNRNAVIIGRNQNTAQEINADFVEKHGISVVRRITGGGAVYHDMGNLNYSFITDATDPESISKAPFVQPVVDALRALGLEAEASGRNDILVSGKKVSGIAQYITKGRILHHGTLLFDSNPAMISGALNPDPTKFQSKSVQSVRSRVGNIREHLKEDMTLAQFWDYLRDRLGRQGLSNCQLDADALAQITKLKAEKYDTWDWNYGRSPAYTTRSRHRWPNGLLEVCFSVKDGFLTEITFRGDFLSVYDPEILSDALIGCPFRKESIAEKLRTCPVTACLGGITDAECLQTIFGLNL